MHIQLAYGRQGLAIDLPEENLTVLAPTFQPALPDEAAALQAALAAPLGAPPLADLVRSTDQVAIVFSDGTRPQPRRAMITAILTALPHVPRRNFVLVNGLGTHRPNTPAELSEMLGDELLAGLRLVQHNAFDRAALARLGTTSYGREVWVNADYLQADKKILTGFIEPHFFAGFSGGPKAVLPGIADQPAILGNHSYGMLSHPKATWGHTRGNPLWEEALEAAQMSRPDFLLNVALNSQHHITGVFAGELLAAYQQGIEFVRAAAMRPAPTPFDIVVTTNAGYPLDQNLYQAVKGMSAAAQVVRPGGAILCAAECSDGVPNHGDFMDILRTSGGPEKLLARLAAEDTRRQDMWQAQILAQIQLKARVYVKSATLDAATLAQAGLQACDSIEATVAALRDEYGPQARICVLPQGPETVPYLS